MICGMHLEHCLYTGWSAESPKVSLGSCFLTKFKSQKGLWTLHVFFLRCCSQLTHVSGHLKSVFLVVYWHVGDVSFRWQIVLMLAYNTSCQSVCTSDILSANWAKGGLTLGVRRLYDIWRKKNMLALTKPVLSKKRKYFFRTQQWRDKTRIIQFSYFGLGFFNRCDNRM